MNIMTEPLQETTTEVKLFASRINGEMPESIVGTQIIDTKEGTKKRVFWLVREGIQITNVFPNDEVILPSDAVCNNCKSSGHNTREELICNNPEVSGNHLGILNRIDGICPKWKN
nr:hypothetical protein [Candidatus Gracilibacteria bacterium]